MGSQKNGNPSESVNLAGDTQRGLGETGNTPVFISLRFVALFRAVNNVSQNLKNTMGVFFRLKKGGHLLAGGFPFLTEKMRLFFCLFWGSL